MKKLLVILMLLASVFVVSPLIAEELTDKQEVDRCVQTMMTPGMPGTMVLEDARLFCDRTYKLTKEQRHFLYTEAGARWLKAHPNWFLHPNMVVPSVK